MVGEVSQAARSLAKSRTFTATAVLTIAIAIAANAAVFSIVHVVILSPLPYREPDRLVAVWEILDGEHGESHRATPAAFATWRQRDHAFEAVAAFDGDRATLTGSGDPVAL